MILDGVNQSLRVLDTHTHSKALRLKAHAIVVESVVDILRRVTRSQHHRRALDELVTHPYACDARAVGVELEARNLARKVYLTARRGYR